MLLRETGMFNEISPELREKLEARVRGFGKSVRYKFDISNENPDPTKHDGKVIYPSVFTLDPATFYITDPLEKRTGKSKTKRIGLVEQVDEKGVPNKFKKIKVDGKYRGILKLEIEEIPEHFDFAMFLEMHPKLTGGDFLDKTKRQMISRIDEQAAATTQRAERTARLKALNVAQGMSDKELINFADAMLWDSTQNPEILRNDAEVLAESNPEFFNDLVAGKSLEYRALIKQCVDKKIIEFNPSEQNFVYSSNKQVIVQTSATSQKSEVEQFSDWLQAGGTKTEEVYKKLKSLNSGKEVAA